MICIPCRNPMPRARYETVTEDERTFDVALCSDCGVRLTSVPRDWAYPKKNDKKAWRDIENGIWAWDRRRVARKYNKRKSHRHYGWSIIVRRPNAKKGQSPIVYSQRWGANVVPGRTLHHKDKGDK